MQCSLSATTQLSLDADALCSELRFETDIHDSLSNGGFGSTADYRWPEGKL